MGSSARSRSARDDDIGSDDDDIDHDDDDELTTTSSADDSMLTRLALFGNSSTALVGSFLLFICSVVASMYLDGSLSSAFLNRLTEVRSSTDLLNYKRLGPIPELGPAIIYEVDGSNSVNSLTREMLVHYERDGVIALRGLLDAATLQRLEQASHQLVLEQHQKNTVKAKERPKVLTGKPPPPKQFFTQKQGVIFSVDADSKERHSAFVQAAMLSNIPKVAAFLLGFDNRNDQSCTNETVRIMRDILLAKDEEEYVCGWHVDDVGFWPALADAPGVNAWIALDDMPVDQGGGFALAVGSHKAEWKEEAYNITGSTHSFPEGGFKSSRDIFQNRPGNGTCNIASSAPHLHKRMENSIRVYNIQKGDVIFHDRWLFHRTIPFDRNYVAERAANENDPLVYKRYSIRFSPGSAVIPPGYGMEPSVLSENQNGGRTAEEVSKHDAPWYPRVWPSVDEKELDQMKILARARFAEAMAKADDRRRVIRPRKSRQH